MSLNGFKPRYLYVLIFGWFLLNSGASFGQEYDYLVIHSTKRYISARLVAEQAAKLLELPIDLRGLKENPVIGLSLPREACILPDGQINYPSYPLRSSKNSGIYISVEYSSAYLGWTPGYYLVVIANAPKNDKDIELLKEKARVYYSDADFRLVEWINR